jgi:hypothetical protein
MLQALEAELSDEKLGVTDLYITLIIFHACQLMYIYKSQVPNEPITPNTDALVYEDEYIAFVRATSHKQTSKTR